MVISINDLSTKVDSYDNDNSVSSKERMGWKYRIATSKIFYRAQRAKDMLLPNLWPQLVTCKYPSLESAEITKRSRIMVFAPHADDEVLGCGGTLAKYAHGGSEIRVVYMTDGRNGNPAYTAEGLIQKRREEATEGLKVLGCRDPVFLGYPDSGLICNKESEDRIASLIDEYGPDAIFSPYYIDNHIDHVRTASIIAGALKHRTGDIDCYCYEVWSVLPPNVIFDISGEMAKKIEAIGKHESQIELIDYVEKIVGLNSYRSMTIGKGVRYCEAFFKCNRPDFIRLVKYGTIG